MNDNMQEVTLLSFLSICAGADWGLSDSQVATISSSVFVGILVGNLFWGPFAGLLDHVMSCFNTFTVHQHDITSILP